MNRFSTFDFIGAALAACLFTAAALSVRPGPPPGQNDRRAHGTARPVAEPSSAPERAAARQVAGRTLMTPEELALLREQVIRASGSTDAGPGSERTR